MDQKLSVGIEQLLGMAAVDPEFAAALLKDRGAAARASGVTLTAVEKRVLDVIGDEALRAMIRNLGGALPETDRRAFITASAAAVMALLAGATGCPIAPTGSRPDEPPPQPSIPRPEPPAPTGIRPDNPPPKPAPKPDVGPPKVPPRPPASRGIRPDRPASRGIRPDRPLTKGSRPDLPGDDQKYSNPFDEK